jgi:hypothetical protein
MYEYQTLLWMTAVVPTGYNTSSGWMQSNIVHYNTAEVDRKKKVKVPEALP